MKSFFFFPKLSLLFTIFKPPVFNPACLFNWLCVHVCFVLSMMTCVHTLAFKFGKVLYHWMCHRFINNSLELYTVILIVLADRRGSVLKMCLSKMCFLSHGPQSCTLCHTSWHYQNVRDGCKITVICFSWDLRLCVMCFCNVFFHQVFPLLHSTPTKWIWLMAGHGEIMKLMCRVNGSLKSVINQLKYMLKWCVCYTCIFKQL